MDESLFWDIIESAGRASDHDQERQLAAVRDRLVGLSREDLADFQSRFDRKLADAYTWDLWGAAYLINGGCSDDGFAYFRAWLISRGRAVYEDAVRDPDTLARVAEGDDCEFEDLWGVARDVFEELTGEEMPAGDFDWPEEPKGERWDFEDEDEISRRLPAIAVRHA